MFNFAVNKKYGNTHEGHSFDKYDYLYIVMGLAIMLQHPISLNPIIWSYVLDESISERSIKEIYNNDPLTIRTAVRYMMESRESLSEEDTFAFLNCRKEEDPDKKLILAAKMGALSVVKYFLDRGADIHAEDEALFRASAYGHSHIVEFLLDHKADIHANNDYALKLASENGLLSIVKLLLDRGANTHVDNECALISASAYDRPDIINLLLDRKANIHARDDYALRWASFKGCLSVVTPS